MSYSLRVFSRAQAFVSSVGMDVRNVGVCKRDDLQKLWAQSYQGAKFDDGSLKERYLSLAQGLAQIYNSFDVQDELVEGDEPNLMTVASAAVDSAIILFYENDYVLFENAPLALVLANLAGYFLNQNQSGIMAKNISAIHADVERYSLYQRPVDEISKRLILTSDEETKISLSREVLDVIKKVCGNIDPLLSLSPNAGMGVSSCESAILFGSAQACPLEDRRIEKFFRASL